MSSARTLVVVVALALLGALMAWFAARDGGEARALEAPREAATRAGAPRESRSAPRSIAAEPSDENERAEVVVETAPHTQAPASVTSEPVAQATPGLELRGRLIVLDPNGVELAPVDGRFELLALRGSRGERLDIEVRAGAWKAQFENANDIDAVQVGEIACGELKPALEAPVGRVPLPLRDELEVRSRLPRASSLRVIDAATGADLADVVLVRAAQFPMDKAAHPGAGFDERVVGRRLRSPIALDALRSSLWSGVLVGAEGYAWSRVELDFERGGERVVALPRGADLEVQVRGVDPTAHSLLRLGTDKHYGPVCEQALSSDATFVLRGLEPATYTIQAEVGEWFREPKQLGATSATLGVGERVRVELALEAAPRFERADAGGVVYVPSEWKLERVLITMNLLDTPLGGQEAHASLPGGRVPSGRTGFDAFSWSHKGLQAGRYEFGTYEPRFSVVVEIPPAGRTDFELVVPPPIELLVYLVDDQTGDPLAVDSVLWNPRRPEGVTGGGLDSAERDAAHERYVIRAPACPIDLHVWSWDFIPSSESVDLSQGVIEHTFRMRRSCGVTLRLEDRGTAVALPDEWNGSPQPLAGAGSVLSSQHRPLSPRWMLREPGLYQLELPKLPGYRQPPVQTIEVLAGRFTEHVVSLEREHP